MLESYRVRAVRELAHGLEHCKLVHQNAKDLGHSVDASDGRGDSLLSHVPARIAVRK